MGRLAARNRDLPIRSAAGFGTAFVLHDSPGTFNLVGEDSAAVRRISTYYRHSQRRAVGQKAHLNDSIVVTGQVPAGGGDPGSGGEELAECGSEVDAVLAAVRR